MRRPWGLCLRVHDQPALDPKELFSGQLVIRRVPTLVACSLLDGPREHEVSPTEVALLARLTAEDWVERSRLTADDAALEAALARLLGLRLVLSDRADPECVPARERDDNLRQAGWSRAAAEFHLRTRWRGVTRPPEAADEALERLRGNPEETIAAVIADRGAPPPVFLARPDADLHLALPPAHLSQLTGSLGELLARRRTVRTFDGSRALPRATLAELLFAVFGCQGMVELAPGHACQARTSPSGGALHPVECYPLVRAVEGVPAGLYHYHGGHHRLERLRVLTAQAVADLIERLTAGQLYYREAHVVLLLTGRFERTFWKYPDHLKAYKVVWLDAGHLSQTWYLAATAVGLGAFFTAAINDGDVDDLLGLDGVTEGALAIAGCGLPAPGSATDALTFQPEPYAPPGA